MPKLDEVFGISTKQIRSYVERPQVDGKFLQALSGHHHVVIYGSSKQGKTALRQKHVEDSKCTIVRCGPRMTSEIIYQSILRDAGVRLEISETKTDSQKSGIRGKWSFKAFLPWLGESGVEGEASGESGRQKSLQTEFVGYDLGEAQSVYELLAHSGYKKYVVLENFHYLPAETQQLIAFDLKTFHEVSIRFIILGIWKEANLLLLQNGDLQDRVTEIPVEPWEDKDFDRVLTKGSDELNILIDAEIREQFKHDAYGNIRLLQEFLKLFCRLNGVADKQATQRTLNDKNKIQQTFEEKLSEQKGRLIKVLDGIAGKSRADREDSLILPYYLVQVILTAPFQELLEGISRQHLLEQIRQLHHRGSTETVRMGDITHLLKRLPALQENIKPPFLYYDTNQKRVKIVDAAQFFVLSRTNRDELRDEIPNPLQKYED